MNVDDKKNRNEKMTLMKIQNVWLNGRGLSLQPQEPAEVLKEWIFQAKLFCLFVPNIIIYMHKYRENTERTQLWDYTKIP